MRVVGVVQMSVADYFIALQTLWKVTLGKILELSDTSRVSVVIYLCVYVTTHVLVILLVRVSAHLSCHSHMSSVHVYVFFAATFQNVMGQYWEVFQSLFSKLIDRVVGVIGMSVSDYFRVFQTLFLGLCF